MSDWPTVAVLLITYKRTDLALRTIRGVQQNLGYDAERLTWHIADDGSPDGHVAALVNEIAAHSPPPTVSNSGRRGVAVSMNLGANACLQRADFVLWLEDDWELARPYDLRPAVQMLQERGDVGMVRLGYVSPGIEGQIITSAGRLWWKLRKGSDTYVFSGHAALRHRRFIEAYQPYAEGLTPGETELWMCGTFAKKDGPTVALPMDTGQWGAFGHIGGESLNGVRPGEG